MPDHNDKRTPDDHNAGGTGGWDDDVPFHLPRAGDEDDDTIAYGRPVPPVSPEEEDVPLDDDETPLENRRAAAPPPRRDPHDLPTMPIPREPGAADPRQTLPGTGGLDPNPDFENTARRESQPTLASMPAVRPQAPAGGQVVPRPAQPPAYVPPPPRQGAGPAPAGPLPVRRQGRRRILGCTPGCLMVFGGLTATFCGGLTLVLIVISATLGTRLERQLQAQVARVDDYQSFESTFFYDRNGTLLYEAFNEGRRTTVRLSDIPQHLIDATLAVEDGSFYTNIGVDVPATGRALLQYVGLMEGGSGGSTITQQLVRNVLFEPEYRAERSINRKIEEILLAVLLTQRKSKDDILAMYLNEVYYGNLAYGAQAAARTFFNKNVGELTLGEAALLAGLPQAPANLDPLNPDPHVQEAVYNRWRTVLDLMVRGGFITEAQRTEAQRQGLAFSEPDVPFRAQHFTVFARQEFEQLLPALGYGPEQLARGGLRVYTTLDLRLNDLAQQAVREQIARLAANNVSNGAVVVTMPLTGEILALVGSADYNNDAIDGRVNVATATRQPGSTMKPFTYAAAFEAGMSTAEVVWDTPLTVTGPGVPPGWPRNYDSRFHGPMRVRSALANSYNIPAVATLRRVGVAGLLEIMQRFGVRSLGNDLERYGLSLTLGGGEVTLLELTRAYSVFANQGALVPTTSILCIVNGDDEILYQYETTCPRGQPTAATVNQGGYGTQVLDPRVAFVISDMLADNAARTPAMGGGSPLFTPGVYTSVKTGTTDDVKDNWTVGFTRNAAVGVWVGNSNGDPMVNSSGLTGAAPIWNAIMTSIYANPDLLASFATGGQLLNDQPQAPAGLTLRQFCDVSRLTDPAPDCGAKVSEWVLDSPAGRPTTDGTLDYPAPPPALPPITSGPNLQLVEPGVFRVMAHRLPPQIAGQITLSVPPGQRQPPAPIYCQVPIELEPSAAAVGAQYLLFIAPPDRPDEAVEAELFARQNNLAFLPTIACQPELLVGGGPGYGPAVVTAVITSPQPGAVLTGETPIIGTVQFTADQARFYKIDVIGGPFTDWVTIGTTHENSVVNGQLENLYVPGLAPGSYRMRLVLVDHSGGFLQAPYEIPFSVGSG